MHRLVWIFVISALVVACTDPTASSLDNASDQSGPFSAVELTALVESVRETYGLPGLGVLIKAGDRPLQIAVSGVRRRGSETAITRDDLWMIGSTAKSMTAMLVATFVQEGSFEFDTRLVEIFPEWTDRFTDEAREITIAQLLGHSAGLQPNPADSPDDLRTLLGDTSDIREQRLKILLDAIAGDLQFPPGSDYAYSNTGYILAAAVVERIGDKDYETLLTERVFEPLGISEYGFGHPAAANGQGAADQPWGHRPSWFRLLPVSPDDPTHTNPFVFNSAGNLHISLADWSVFVRDQLNGQKGMGALADQSIYERMQRPENGETGYALGWGVLVEEGIPAMLTHNGSDGSWFADVRAYPPTDKMLLVVINDGRDDDEAKAAAAAIRRVFSNRYRPFIN